MARFVFNLQSVLNARLATERERQRAVAVLERQRLDLEEGLRRQQAMIESGRDALRQVLVGRVDTTMLRGQAAATMRMMRDAQGLALELAQVYEKMGPARADLAKAAAARRAMELLRDRRFAEWTKAMSKKEAAALDDLAGAKASQRRTHKEVLP